jgi:crotonobetainyl-CoA:carnitine CoA-transferase CaiB-like acyl-CoA transferase
MRDVPGQDLMVQARSGLVSATGSRPTAVGAPVVDHHGAALLALGVLAAYARLLETGTGTRVESSLLHAGLDLQSEPIMLWHAEQADRSRYDRQENLAAWYIDAPYGVYELADCHIVISTGPNIANLPKALGCEALMPLANADRMAVRDRYAAILAEELRKWRWDDLDRAFAAHGIWYQRILADYGELDRDPQIAAAEVFTDFPIGDRTVRLVNHPIKYDGKTPEIRRIPFEIGHDTREILSEAGFAAGDIEDLISSRAVAAPDPGTGA